MLFPSMSRYPGVLIDIVLSTNALDITNDRLRSCSTSTRRIPGRICHIQPSLNLARPKGDWIFTFNTKWQWGWNLCVMMISLCNILDGFRRKQGLMELLFLCLTTSFSQRLPKYLRLSNYLPTSSFCLPSTQTFRNCTISCSVTTSVRCGF
jgi:hypothetical protein